MSDVFKALSDPTRRKVLTLLRSGPMTAGDIADCFNVSKSTMSAHFAVLRNAGLIGAEKQGTTITYHLQLSVLEDALFGFAAAFKLNAGEETPSADAGGRRDKGASRP